MMQLFNVLSGDGFKMGGFVCFAGQNLLIEAPTRHTYIK